MGEQNSSGFSFFRDLAAKFQAAASPTPPNGSKQPPPPPSGSSAEPRHPTDDEKRRAEESKELGNQAFKRGFWEAAILHYSGSIKLNPLEPVYRTNRALAYMRLRSWRNVIIDSRNALALDHDNLKGHYLLGTSLCETGEYEEGFKRLYKAKALSKCRQFTEDCDRVLRTVKARRWHEQQACRAEELSNLKLFLENELRESVRSGRLSEEEASRRLTQVDGLVSEASPEGKRQVVPEHFCCRISMCLMKSPVVTSSGLTYEAELLYQHLAKNGNFDPITRKACFPHEVWPNLALRDAIDDFVEKNPWAAEDFV